MGYYIRVLGTDNKDVPASLLQEAIDAEKLQARVKLESGKDAAWDQVVVEHPDGQEITAIERNPVVKGELGEEELQELVEETGDAKPASAAQWLADYLPNVKVIYALQILHGGAEVGEGWRIIQIVQNALWNQVGGVLQADDEGFSNEEGYHILWQFSDHVKGPWNMALLDSDGTWVKFTMDLGDKKQRQAFMAGKVPPKAKIIS
jgi:hypothetical protein